MTASREQYQLAVDVRKAALTAAKAAQAAKRSPDYRRLANHAKILRAAADALLEAIYADIGDGNG